jgi:predicted Zn finger-like uncharacterized protein
MRLICPSCGAQYEVDADLIPETGRDVQCSACGHVWFEGYGASADEDAEAETPVAEPEVAEPEVEAPPTFVEEPPPPVTPARAPRRTVTPQIAEILREEAERERAVRAAQAQVTIERQEELPLTEPEAAPVVVPEVAAAVAEAPAPVEPAAEPAPVPARDEVAEAVQAAMQAEAERAAAAPVAAPVAAVAVPAATIRASAPPAPTVAPVQAPRRDRLPDIEEINSTLRPAGERAPRPAAQESAAPSGRGFRLGFSLVLFVAAALALVYVFAPRIIAAVPATEPVVAPYAAAVDEGRLWLDLRLQDLVEALGTEPAAEG